jgi:DNA-directed RNA polymerase specialized sigma24 family protein
LVKSNPGWALTKEALDVLLARLHPDREQAGQSYEALRLKLSFYFEARQHQASEALVDETFNRLARKILIGEEIRNIEAFALSIARFVCLEERRESMTVSLDEILAKVELKLSVSNEQENEQSLTDAARLNYMRQAVLNLSEPTRQLLSEYHQLSGSEQAAQRREMAARLGISENALYLKIFRIRQKLTAELAAYLKSP